MYGTKQMEMIVFASVTNQAKIQLNPEGLKVLEKFLQGQVTLVVMQGFLNKQYKISQSFTHSRLRSNNSGDKIWIRPQPVFDQKARKYLFFLQTQMHETEGAKQILHTLACLISYTVVVAVEPTQSIYYFSSIQKKLSDEMPGKKYLDPNIKYKVAHLLALMPSDKKSQQGDYFVDITEQLFDMLTKQNILNQVLSSYSSVSCRGCPQKDLQYSSQILQRNLLQDVQVLCDSQRQNTQLMYGPIIAEYIRNIVAQMNAHRSINLQSAENDIQIDQAYQAYTAGVKKFHTTSLLNINKFQRPDDGEITSSLDIAKKAAIQQFFSKNGASNMKYKRILDDYINHKQVEVRKAYSFEQNDTNLNILEIQSKIAMDRIQRQRKANDTQFIKQQLQTMKKNYEHQSKGPQKYSIYNDYMKVFTPIAYGHSQKQADLQQKKRINKQLQRKLSQLNKKKGGCCAGGCQIM